MVMYEVVRYAYPHAAERDSRPVATVPLRDVVDVVVVDEMSAGRKRLAIAAGNAHAAVAGVGDFAAGDAVLAPAGNANRVGADVANSAVGYQATLAQSDVHRLCPGALHRQAAEFDV
jgi:hypothetical protein